MNVQDNFIYKYDYSQNQPWTWHGFEMTVDVNKYYTFSFDAYISEDANIPSTGWEKEEAFIKINDVFFCVPI